MHPLIFTRTAQALVVVVASVAWGCSLEEGVTPTCSDNATATGVETDPDGCNQRARCQDPLVCCGDALTEAQAAQAAGEAVTFDYANCLRGYGVDPDTIGVGGAGGSGGANAGGAGGANGGGGGGGAGGGGTGG